MPFFSEMKIKEDFNLLIGIENDTVVFSHCFRNKQEKVQILEMEKVYFPELEPNEGKLMPLFYRLETYFKGGDVDPSLHTVRYSRGTRFERGIWQKCRGVKKGQLVNYELLGQMAGFKRASRAVGNAMAKNYLLLFVPCHRVIRKDKKLGGFSAGVEKKEFLIGIENGNPV